MHIEQDRTTRLDWMPSSVSGGGKVMHIGPMNHLQTLHQVKLTAVLSSLDQGIILSLGQGQKFFPIVWATIPSIKGVHFQDLFGAPHHPIASLWLACTSSMEMMVVLVMQ